MRFLFLAVTLMLQPSMAAAQSNTVIRSGEHPTFTRLVIDMARDTNWSATLADRAVNIEIPQIGELNTSPVFQRVPRTRLLAVTSSDDGLTLRLGCSCPVQVFELSNGSLVIDIRDPEAQPVVDATDLATAPPVEVAQAEPTPPIFEDAVPEPQMPIVDLVDVRDRLVEQLTRAADQGLLSLSESIDQDVSTVTEATPATEPVPENTMPPPLEGIETQQQETGDPFVDIRTAFERARYNDAIQSNDCVFPAPILEGSTQERYQEYIALQSDVFEEFDRVNIQKLQKMILLALGLGLGAEAQNHITQHSQQLGNAAVLADMARLIDSRPTGLALVAYQNCGGVAGFWGRLANVSRENLERFAPQDLATLEDMPPDSRILFATIAIENWVNNNMPSTAQAALELAIRTGATLPPELELSSARIAVLRENTIEAKSKFMALLDEPGLVGLHAMVQLVELTLAQNEPLGPDVELDLAAAAFQLGGTSTGRDAIRALAQIRARDGNLSRSLALLTQSAAREPEMADIWRRVAADLIETAPALTPDYARAVVQNAIFLPDGISGDDARVAAGRGLIELGLPSEAIAILRPAASRGNQIAADLLQTTEKSENEANTLIFPDTNNLTIDQSPVSPEPVTVSQAEELIRNGDQLRLSASELISGIDN